MTDLGAGVTITPLCAGHSLGGTFWRIRKGKQYPQRQLCVVLSYERSCSSLRHRLAETEEIIYATDFYHAKER